MSSVLSSGQFCGKSLRDPGHGVSGHVFDGTRKDKETLRVELVETPATRVVELLAL